MQQSECEKLLRSLKSRLETELQKAEERQVQSQATGEIYDEFYASGKMVALLSAIGFVLDCLPNAYRQIKP